MKTSKAALAAMALLGGSSFLAGSANAQYGGGQSAPPTTPQVPPRPAPSAPPPAGQPAQPERAYNLSRAERAALQPALIAVNASNWDAATAALPAAAAAAHGADAKYVVAQIRLRIGISTSNAPLQSQAIDELIASGGALPAEMPALLQTQMELANAAGDHAKAEHALSQLLALNPNDPTLILRVAQARAHANDGPGAVALYRRAIQAQQAAGRPVPPAWRQQVVAAAYQAHMPETTTYMRELLMDAPTPSNWHDALTIYKELGNANSALKLDIFRLMHAAGAMSAEGDFIQYSEAANEVRAFGEVKSILEEGLARNIFTANLAYARDRLGLATQRAADDRTSLAGEMRTTMAGGDGTAALRLGDAFFGYGQYAEAIQLYRAALQKGGQDANLVNTRLGAALALAGQRGEAETAFHAVTGPRAELAQLWLFWLSTRSH